MKAKYYLYRNLRTGGFSIKHRGKVIDHADFVTMENVEFRVGTGGNKRAKESGQRNVHAYMVADSYRTNQNVLWQPSAFTRVTYNPFQNSTFVNAKTGEPIRKASYAIATTNRVFVK